MDKAKIPNFIYHVSCHCDKNTKAFFNFQGRDKTCLVFPGSYFCFANPIQMQTVTFEQWEKVLNWDYGKQQISLVGEEIISWRHKRIKQSFMSLTVCADQRVNDEFLAVDSCSVEYCADFRWKKKKFML